jgi:cytochrome c-type biogenesis protein CcmH
LIVMTKRWLLSLVPLVALIGALAVFQGVSAQEPTPSDDEVNSIAKELYCPVCENIPLDVCPTAACEQWRGLIREKLTAGWSEQQIKDFFVLQYGDRVLAEPPLRGLNWLVYILPPLILLGGVLLVAGILRNMRRSVPSQPVIPGEGHPPAPAQPGTVGPDYLKRFEDELRKRSE